MTSATVVPGQETDALAEVADYLRLTPEQRYGFICQQFPIWLRSDPIEFPPHHPTFGWACRVSGCGGSIASTYTGQLCSIHAKQYFRVKKSTAFEEFVTAAEPVSAHTLGWALTRRQPCGICGTNREANVRGYCTAHWQSLSKTRQRGADEQIWRASQSPMPPFGACAIRRCVHDGELHTLAEGDEYRICRAHFHQWQKSIKSAGPHIDTEFWQRWIKEAEEGDSVRGVESRGEVSIAGLPLGMQREFRYACHRHAKTARRTQWRPVELQTVVDMLAGSGIESLQDERAVALAKSMERKCSRRLLQDMMFAARSLSVSDVDAKTAGWFDPIIVGAKPFPGSQLEKNRRKVWDLTAISQKWLRDLLWEYLRDQALQPDGKQPVSGTIFTRITGILLLSCLLRQNRNDQGEKPSQLGSADAHAVKETWDLWFREKLPIPRLTDTRRKDAVLTEGHRHTYMSAIRRVLLHSRERGRTPESMDRFIFSLPEYASPASGPRPRPLTYGDFQLLVSPDSIGALEAIDRLDMGIADIWLTHAFQGGRISETLGLRLGCVGLIGAAQPYIWRDISKVGVIDYGMPCYLPVFDRLLQRQKKTREKLRSRYYEQLAALDDRGRHKLEATWDREMPLFPGPQANPDLVLEISQSWFREAWIGWFESLGMKGLTTHQTRATLATSLLNNGAPAALVRQLLGHFSAEALAHYANYNNDSMTRHLQRVWAAGPGMDKPGTILLRPTEVKVDDTAAAAARIDLTMVPVDHGLCRYGPVVGGAQCPFGKNCSSGPKGACEHFVLTGADLAYWERKRDAAYHFAEGAPNDEARDYILSQWQAWDEVLAGLREALDELGLLEEAEKLDLRTPVHDYFDPVFSTAWPLTELGPAARESTRTEHTK